VANGVLNLIERMTVASLTSLCGQSKVSCLAEDCPGAVRARPCRRAVSVVRQPSERGHAMKEVQLRHWPSRRGEDMRVTIVVLATIFLVAGGGCGNLVNPPPAQGQSPPPPQFSGIFAFGNGPLVGAINASNGNLTGTLAFAGSCPAQVTGTYQEIGQNGQPTGQTAFGQLTATTLATTSGCVVGSAVFNFFVAVSSTKAYFSFSQAGTTTQLLAEGFK